MQKIRVRHVLFFLLSFGYILYTAPRPICRINAAGLIWSVIPLFVVLMIAELFFLIRKSYSIVAHLHKGDVETFLAETEKELKYSIGNWRQCYLVNKSAGLYYQGKFNEATELLKGINPKKLPKMYRYLRVNNLLANLLGAERIEEAGRLIDDHPEVFIPSRYNQKFYPAIQTNLGIYKYHKEEFQTARHLIKTNIKDQKMPLSRAVGYYYLSRISTAENQTNEAQEYLKKAKKLGANTFIDHA